jgi:spore coat protein U-like protein
VGPWDVRAQPHLAEKAGAEMGAASSWRYNPGAVRILCPIAFALLAAALPARSRAASCNFSSNGIAFGAYDPTAPATVRVAGTIEYHCSSDTWAVILIDGGSSHDVNARRMTSGPERLAYNIYTNPGGTDVWGNTMGSGLWTVLRKGPGWGSVPAYGVVAPYQDVAAGAYADTLTVTVLFF